MSDDVPFRLPPVDPGSAGTVAAASLSPELLAGLLAEGDEELASWTLRHALAEDSRAAVYDGLLRDAMELVGERWASGRWTIAEEHLASRTLLRALDRIAPDPGPAGRIGPVAALAGVSGEHHMLGLVCLEHVLVEAGWTVANLGADLPAADLGAWVAKNDVSLVALTASHPARLATLADAVAAVRNAGTARRIPVIVGGRLATRPGIAVAVDADGSTPTLRDALAFAAAHRPEAGT